MKSHRLLSAIFLLLGALLVASAQSARHVPTVNELITLKTVGAVQISPDAKWVAYTVGYGDFKTDSFLNQIWLIETATGRNFQVTRGDKSSTSLRWSPVGTWLTFLSNRVEDKNQIFAINPLGGEALQITKSQTAISNFSWSEDRKWTAYLPSEPNAPVSKERKQYMGDF